MPSPFAEPQRRRSDAERNRDRILDAGSSGDLRHRHLGGAVRQYLTGRVGMAVGWPGGVSPPGSHRTVRDSLPSHGSCHPDHQNVRIQAQCANRRGHRVVIASQNALTFLNPRSRRYFLESQRTR